MSNRFAAPTDDAVPIKILTPDQAAGVENLGPVAAAQLAARPFKGGLGEVRPLLGADGTLTQVLVGWGTAVERAREQFPLGNLAAALPMGVYRLDGALEAQDMSKVALAWLLSAYRFDRYKTKSPQEAQLIAPDGVDAARLEVEAKACALTADLVNTPTNDLGPDALESTVWSLGERHDAGITVIRGGDLLVRNLPLIHTVGRASDMAPRLIDLVWGRSDAPKVTLVGKGVCFDTGGLNLKPGGAMGLMKKDMGGAATVIGLAQMVMESGLDIRLRMLIPAVENSVSAGAFRPGDVLTSRAGLTVEVNNTDAEGRLVLADALALGDEEEPEVMISMATLTGAARVALGPDMPAMFTDDDALALALAEAAATRADPLWRLPFWTPYESMIEPDIADLDNAPKGGFAGAITAALFLRRFVSQAGAYAHFDCYAWTPSAKPGRPKGGTAQGARALFEVLRRRYG
ncbi:MAG: leucyl aminopeptidase family protein [Pseudomonadota bacterium]